jgi:IS1 family transposase
VKYRDLFCRTAGFEQVRCYLAGLLLSKNKTLKGIAGHWLSDGDMGGRRAMHAAVFEHDLASYWKLQALLAPFGIEQFSTDHWGSYSRYLEQSKRRVGKANPQKIERKHLRLRARIER